MGKLDGRVAVITSGSTGIGRGIGEAFLAEGASIVINGRDAEKGAKALKEMNAGDRGHFIRGDVTVREDIDAVVAGAVEHFGKIDILVNNAGGLIKTAPVANLADEDWDYAIKWNLYSAFWASRKALEYMIPQEFGRIIMISSVEGKHGKPAIPAYVTCKHAMIGLAKAIAKENGTSGITCNAICPGWVLTPLVEKQLEDRAKEAGTDVETEKKKMLQESQPMLKFTTPAEIGALVMFLCSDGAATITGAPLSIDGGWVAH